MEIRKVMGRIKSLSESNIPPFVKGGWGDFPKRAKENPPMSPFFKGRFNDGSLFKDKL
jgi:hypothetical protein